MYIQSLTLQNFRNIHSILFSPGEGANIIYGNNAQGKTNLLEAIWLFTGAKSFRGAKDREFIGFEQPGASLELTFYAQAREQSASLVWSGENRRVKLNEIKQGRRSALSGVFCSVVFSPDHLQLIKQGPDKRRRMIDTSLCQAYPKYGKVLEGYGKALKQRNTLLRDIPRSASLLDTLDVWDHNLAEYGSYIMDMRNRYIRALCRHAREYYNGISSGREAFDMTYRPGMEWEPGDMDRAAARTQLLGQLAKGRGDDIRSGMTETGPHRDDLEITIDGRSARAFGSQGQQRSCVLAIKLAECGILQERNGEPPIVMLDDVMSELDELRRGFLLNQLDGKQVFITCCDARDFSELKGGRVFHIQAGALLAQDSANSAPVQSG